VTCYVFCIILAGLVIILTAILANCWIDGVCHCGRNLLRVGSAQFTEGWGPCTREPSPSLQARACAEQAVAANELSMWMQSGCEGSVHVWCFCHES
jgi:hypothetical protein